MHHPAVANGTRAVDFARKEINARLDKILRHLARRETNAKECAAFREQDTFGPCDTPRKKKFWELVAKIEDEEIDVLGELVHLRDNILKFVSANSPKLSTNKRRRSSGHSRSALSAIEDSPVYVVAANFVNVHKHGIRGENHDSAVFELVLVAYTEDNPDRSGTSPCVGGVHVLINFRGKLYSSRELIDDLLHIWEIFIRNYLSLDTDDFRKRIRTTDKKKLECKTYFFNLDEGLLAWAKDRATERRTLADIALPTSKELIANVQMCSTLPTAKRIIASFESVLLAICERDKKRQMFSISTECGKLVLRERKAHFDGQLMPIRAEDLKTLQLIVDLVSSIRVFIIEQGISPKGIDAIETHKAFKAAQLALSNTHSTVYYALLCKRADLKSSTEKVEDVIYYTEVNGQLFAWPGIIADLCCLCDIFVRNQTSISLGVVGDSFRKAIQRNFALTEIAILSKGKVFRT